MARTFTSAATKYITCTRVQAIESVANFTLCGWVKKAQNKEWILGKIDASLRNGFYINGYTDNVIYLSVRGATAPFAYVANAIYNTYYHFAMVFSGGGATNADKCKFYINGTLQSLTFAATAWPTANGNSTGLFTIGRGGEYTAEKTDADFGNIRLYLASLTIDQVNADKLGHLPIASLLNMPLGLADTEPDYSGNGYMGTLVNAPAIANGPPVCIPFTYPTDDYGGLVQSNSPRAYYRNLLMRAA